MIFKRNKQKNTEGDWKAYACSIVTGMPDGAAVLASDLTFVDCNRMFVPMAGMRPRMLERLQGEGRTIFDVVYDDAKGDRVLAEKCVATGKNVHTPWVTVHNDSGSTFEVMRTFLPILSPAGETVGIMAIYRDVIAEASMHDHYRALIAQEAARAQELEFRVEQRTEELRAALEEVTRLSRTDPLTGALNRRAFTEYANQALALAARHGRSGAILMCDLDFFKSINDTYGHSAGDKLLIAVAHGLGDLVRGSDKVARFGGEEFVVLLAETEPESVFEIAERFRTMVMELPISEIIEGKISPQTVSIGAAIFPTEATGLDTLIEFADAALYVAKDHGRNRTVLYEQGMSGEEAATVPAEKSLGRSQPKVLVVDSDETRLARYKEMLGEHYAVAIVGEPEHGLALCARERFDAIVVDAGRPDSSAFIRKTLTVRPSAVRILLLASQGDYMTKRAATRGAVDFYLLREEAERHLVQAIADGVDQRELALNELMGSITELGASAVSPAIVSEVISQRKVRMVYQPIVEAATRRVVAYEALCRPTDPTITSPAELFDGAVEAGETWPLGNLIRDLIRADMSAVELDVPIFVNLHPAELENPDVQEGRPFADDFANRIVFEITERASLGNLPHFQQVLGNLRNFGFRFAIDDLGAGYAGLNSVAIAGPEFIKIDLTLIRDIDTCARRQGLVRSLVAFANSAGVKVIAEGIESEAEARVVKELGCHWLQGYLFARPAPFEEHGVLFRAVADAAPSS